MNTHRAKPLHKDGLWRGVRSWLLSHAPGNALAPGGIHAPPRTPPTAELDTEALRDLHAAVGPERAPLLLADFVRDTAARVARMRACTETPGSVVDWAVLAREAHDLSGNAGSFGLTRLGDLAHRLRGVIEARDEVALRDAIAHLVECAQVDLAHLANWAQPE